ncbi:MAG: glycosyltransferase family 2 protein [Patescibacteria group bacterium]
MKVSVIIPTYNEEKVIRQCLESLSKQTYPDYEIIVVDDGSSDSTVKVIKSLITDHHPPITMLHQKHFGPGAARNFGAKKARSEILVFVDADMTFESGFIKKLVGPIVKGKAKGTFSKEEYVSNWENVWARCWNINQNWPDKKRHPKDYPDEDRVFRAILKSEFDKAGGFTPGGYTDDYSLFEKLGYKAKAAKGAMFYHKNPESLSEIFHQARWAGKRPYKLGYFGYLAGLTRASLPASIVVGLVKSLTNFQPAFLVFKIVYDFGVFIGILSFISTAKGSK